MSPAGLNIEGHHAFNCIQPPFVYVIMMKQLETTLLIRSFILFFLSAGFMAGVAQTTLDTAVNFSVKDVKGNTHELFDILGEDKIVVIDFFSAT